MYSDSVIYVPTKYSRQFSWGVIIMTWFTKGKYKWMTQIHLKMSIFSIKHVPFDSPFHRGSANRFVQAEIKFLKNYTAWIDSWIGQESWIDSYATWINSLQTNIWILQFSAYQSIRETRQLTPIDWYNTKTWFLTFQV
jgi:hypothetical protein